MNKMILYSKMTALLSYDIFIRNGRVTELLFVYSLQWLCNVGGTNHTVEDQHV